MLKALLVYVFFTVLTASLLCACGVSLSSKTGSVAGAPPATQLNAASYASKSCPESEAAIRSLHQKMTDFKRGVFDAYYCK